MNKSRGWMLALVFALLLGGVGVMAQEETTRPLDAVLEAFEAFDGVTSYRLLTEEDSAQTITSGDGGITIHQTITLDRKGALGVGQDGELAASLSERRYASAALGDADPTSESGLLEHIFYGDALYSRSTSAADGVLPETWTQTAGAIPQDAVDVSFYKDLLVGLRFAPSADNILLAEALDPLTTAEGGTLVAYRVILDPAQVLTPSQAAQLLDPRLFGSDRESLFTSERVDASVELLVWIDADGLPARVDTIIAYTLVLQAPLSDTLLTVSGRQVASDVYYDFGADVLISVPEVE